MKHKNGDENRRGLARRSFLTLAAAGVGGMAAGCSVFDPRGYRATLGELSGRFSAEPMPALGRENGDGIDGAWLRSFIERMVDNDPDNRLEGEFAGERIYEKPIVGFASTADKIFTDYKTIIGDFHKTPEEALMGAAHIQGVKAPAPADAGIVSFILPFADPIVDTNADQAEWCSERWAQARLVGGLFTKKVERALQAELAKYGILTVAPDLMPDFAAKKRPRVGWASNWSFRHLAFAAGLGSFGMSDLFITERGVAHRAGALAIALPLKPDRERPSHHLAHCLHHTDGGCLLCASRCPASAIGENGHDKNVCQKRVLSSWPRNHLKFSVNIYGCGLCGTATPCSRGIPA